MKQFHQNSFAVYSFYDEPQIDGQYLDVHKAIKSKDIEITNKQIIVKNSNFNENAVSTIEFSTWLPHASIPYKISSNIDDYILVPVITIPTDLPNRNGVAFPLKELIKFDTEQGQPAYKTFRGKPVFYEHKNDNVELAYGVIADAFLKPMNKYGQGKVWKLLELLAIDRNKYPTIADAIIKRELNSYSMGAYVDGYTCSYCDAEFGKCEHLHQNDPIDFYELNGHLVFRKVYGIVGFETSIVVSPAYMSAINDNLLNLK